MFFSNFEKVSRLAQTLYHPCEGITIPNKLRVLPNWILIQQNGGWRPAYFQFEIHPNLPTNRTPQHQKQTSKKTKENMVPSKWHIFFLFKVVTFLFRLEFFLGCRKTASFFPLAFVDSWSKFRCLSSSAFLASSAAAASLAFRWISSFFFFPWPETQVNDGTLLLINAGPPLLRDSGFIYLLFICSWKNDDIFQDCSNIGTSNQAKLEKKTPFKLQAKNALASAMSFQLTTFYGLGRLPSVHVTLLVVASQPPPAWVGGWTHPTKAGW